MNVMRKLKDFLVKVGVTPQGLIYELLLLLAIFATYSGYTSGAMALVAAALFMLPDVMKEAEHD